MRHALVLLVASLAAPVALFACVNDDITPPGPKTIGVVDASTVKEAGVLDALPEASADAPIDSTWISSTASVLSHGVELMSVPSI